MIEVALALDKSVRGKQLLALFQIDKVERSKVTELKSIEKLYKEYLKLNKGRK
jgi:hypothetical protein